MRKIIVLFFVFALIASLSGCKKSENTAEEIKNYFLETVKYEADDLRVVDEGENGYTIVYVIGSSYGYDDFAAFANSVVEAQGNYKEHKIYYVNPVLKTSEHTWIGWSNGNRERAFTFYDQDKYEAYKVPVDKIEDEIRNYKAYLNGEATSSSSEPEQTGDLMGFQKALATHLKNASTVTALANKVKVSDVGWITVNVDTESYDSYAFAAVVTESANYVKDHAKTYGIEKCTLVVATPRDVKYKASWISDDMESGVLNDTQKNFDKTVTVEELQDLYGYEGLL